MPTATWTRIVIFLAAATWLAVSLLMGVPVDREWVKPVGIVTSVVTLSLLGFDLYLWRWFPRRLVKIPNLAGTWHAELTSSFNNEAGQSVKLACFLVIRQTYSRVHIEMLFPKSESVSTSASVLLTDGTAELWYSYRSEAHALDRDGNPPHKGAVQLRIATNGTTRMTGSYWTDRRTYGRIETLSHKRIVINDYEAATAAFASSATEEA